LGDGPRRAGRALPRAAHASGLPVPADGEPRVCAPKLATRVPRLPLHVPDQRDGVQPDGHDAADAHGEDRHGHAVPDGAAHHRAHRGPGGEHPGDLTGPRPLPMLGRSPRRRAEPRQAQGWAGSRRPRRTMKLAVPPVRTTTRPSTVARSRGAQPTRIQSGAFDVKRLEAPPARVPSKRVSPVASPRWTVTHEPAWPRPVSLRVRRRGTAAARAGGGDAAIDAGAAGGGVRAAGDGLPPEELHSPDETASAISPRPPTANQTTRVRTRPAAAPRRLARGISSGGGRSSSSGKRSSNSSMKGFRSRPTAMADVRRKARA